VEKLLHSEMPYGYITPIKFLFIGSDDPASKKILDKGIQCPSLDHCLKRIISTQDFAVCVFGVHTLYLSYQKKYSFSRGPKFIPFKDVVVTYLPSMFFRSGSPFLESFNRIIYRMVSAGMVKHFWEDIKRLDIGQLDDEDEDGDEDDDDEGSDPEVLTLDHLQGAFSFLILGLAFSLIVFIIELLYFIFREFLFYRLLKRSVREFKTRSFVRYKRHVIHKTYVRRVEKQKLMLGKVKI
jgi:hypothetical protein